MLKKMINNLTPTIAAQWGPARGTQVAPLSHAENIVGSPEGANKFVRSTSSFRLADRSLEIIKSASLAEIGQLVDNHHSWKEEILNMLVWEFKVFPSILLLCFLLSMDELLYRKSAGYWTDNHFVVVYSTIVSCFSITLGIMYRDFGFKFWEIVLTLSSLICTIVTFLSVAKAHGFPWSLHTSVLFASLVYGGSGAVNTQVAQFLTGSMQRNLLHSLFVSAFTAFSAAMSMFVIVEYGYFCGLSHDWVVEFLVSGFVYPAISLGFGRFIVADFLSFLLLSTFQSKSSKNVFSFYSIMVKCTYYFAGQIAILQLESRDAFFISAIMNSIAEISGTYINITTMQHFAAKSHTYYEGNLQRFPLLVDWITVRTSLSRQKLALHIHDEEIGEKLVLFSACALQMTKDFLVAGSFQRSTLIRCAILIVLDFIQNVAQRRILQKCAGISIVGLRPYFPHFKDIVNFLCIVLVSRKLFAIANYS